MKTKVPLRRPVPRSSDSGSTQTPRGGAPSPTSWDVDIGALDAQVAAGPSHLIVTNTGQVAIYKKDGTLRQSFLTRDLFAPMLTSLNANLNIPSELQTKYKLDTFYDTRVLYDPYRKRFWLGCLVRNSGARDGKPVDQTYRRSKFALAVSATTDPEGDWYLYWWDAIIDDGACNDPTKLPNEGSCPNSNFSPGNGADYPAIGISSKLFLHSNWTNKSNLLTVVKADDLAAGSLRPGQVSVWQTAELHYSDGTIVKDVHLHPAKHHGNGLNSGLFASTRGNDTLVVWGATFIGDEDEPLISRHEVSVQPFNPPADGVQKKPEEYIGSPIIVMPIDMGIRNSGNSVLGASYRAKNLHVTWPDCTYWEAAQNCLASIRLVRIDVSAFPFFVTKTIDRTFGHRSKDDPAGTVFSYGWPALAVTKNGDMIVSYNRSGATIFPESRYSVFYNGKADIDPSRLLKAGEFPLGPLHTIFPGYVPIPVGRLDNTGSAVDPENEDLVWVVHAYSKQADDEKGEFQLRVHRVSP